MIYDAENRLIEVKKNSVSMATFVYDGDGKQVKSVINGLITTFVGAHYQVENGLVSKYYFAGMQRIAVRKNGTLSYLLGDHLGSTSLTTDSAGNLISELRYKPWGETRYSSGTTPTNYKYTGQREESSFGLYFYNARWYDSSIGRFAQADTIVTGGVQGWDRYAYANNNPLKYIDPTGHVSCEGQNADDGPQCFTSTSTQFWKDKIKRTFGITMSEENDPNNPNAKVWDLKNLKIVFGALITINEALHGKLKSLVGGATFKWGEHTRTGGPDDLSTYHGLTYGTTITFYTIGNGAIRNMNIFHEFGHLIDNSPGMVDVFSGDPGINNSDFLTDDGYLDRLALVSKTGDAIQHSYSIYADVSDKDARQEHWADIFANYVAGNIDLSSPQGSAMNTFVTGALAPYTGAP